MARLLLATLAFLLPATALGGVVSIDVASGTSCPSAEQLALALRAVVSETEVRLGSSEPAHTVQVIDEGASYRVIIGTTDQRLQDPARRCEARAEAAAVLVVLAVNPPAVPRPVPSPSVAPPSAPAPVPSTPSGTPTIQSRDSPALQVTRFRPRRRPPLVELGASGLVASAPTAGGSPVTGGGSIRAAFGTRHFAVTLGAGGTAPIQLTFKTANASLTRLPFDIGGRALFSRSRFDFGADVGFSLALLLVSGDARPNLLPAAQSVRVEVGLRIAPFVRYWLTERFGLFAGPELVVVFHPYALTVSPDGSVGATPSLWLGGSGGLVVKL